MPRRSKKKAAKPKGETYFKAKNGRFYKKVEIDGKTRVRFVSNAEATGAIKTSKSSTKPKAATRKRRATKKSRAPAEATAESPEEKTEVSEE